MCPSGKFRYKGMPFGLRNEQAVFQTWYLMAVRNLLNLTYDVVIFSKLWQDHFSHIDQVLTALGKAGLTVNPTSESGDVDVCST